jgi:hypothetical protein
MTYETPRALTGGVPDTSGQRYMYVMAAASSRPPRNEAPPAPREESRVRTSAASSATRRERVAKAIAYTFDTHRSLLAALAKR